MPNNRLEIGKAAYKELITLLRNNSQFVTYDNLATWITRIEKIKTDVIFIRKFVDCDVLSLSMLIV